MASHSNSIAYLRADGNSRNHIGDNISNGTNYNTYHTNHYQSAGSSSCLADLYVTNPEDDKTRIERSKGSLLRESFQWILKTPEFQEWLAVRQNRLLWVKGNPGKGKTMLLCGIIDELREKYHAPINNTDKASASKIRKTTARLSFSKQAQGQPPTGKGIDSPSLLAFFFCQATDDRINSATAVLRGLIWLLVKQRMSLERHVREQYDSYGRRIFEDTNAWEALSQIFLSILEDPDLPEAHLVIDALDECVSGRDDLLQLLVSSLSKSSRVKWVVSSRNWRDIERRLEDVEHGAPLSLELNAESVSEAVEVFIRLKTERLARDNRYDKMTSKFVHDYLSEKSQDTFLWVALVCNELKDTRAENTLAKLQKFPATLDKLYERMMQQFLGLREQADVSRCKQVLGIACAVHRPVTVQELCALSRAPNVTPIDIQSTREIVKLCGSFLAMEDESETASVHFIHQSVKDYLGRDGPQAWFPADQIAQIHGDIFRKSLDVLSLQLKRDMYNLQHPGTLITDVKTPSPDPLGTARYACVYWVNHLRECLAEGPMSAADVDKISVFLKKNFLYWLEALSLLEHIHPGIASVRDLSHLLEEKPQTSLFIFDMHRFILAHGSEIQEAPLQTYASALVFSPYDSLVRREFWDQHKPNWLTGFPVVANSWSACTLTLAWHKYWVNDVAFSPDGIYIASASEDQTLQIWNSETGAKVRKLIGHEEGVLAVSWSPDGQCIASGSYDRTLKVWDAATGAELASIAGHPGTIRSVAWSPNGTRIASGSDDQTIRIWEKRGDSEPLVLKGHLGVVMALDWSPDGGRLVSASVDGTLLIWNTTTGARLHSPRGYSGFVNSVAWSPDGSRIVSGSGDLMLKIWDATTFSELRTLQGHSGWVNSVAWSPDSKRILSGSDDWTLRIWDLDDADPAVSTLSGHTASVSAVAWSPTGKIVLSCSEDTTVRIWSPNEDEHKVPEKHTDVVERLIWSPDGEQLASRSYGTLRTWDAMGSPIEVEDYPSYLNPTGLVVWSPNGRKFVRADEFGVLSTWDPGDRVAELQSPFDHHTRITALEWSTDGRRIASGSKNGDVHIHRADMFGSEPSTFKGHADKVTTVAWSPDCTQVVSGSVDHTLRIWDIEATRIGSQTLSGHTEAILSVAWSRDGKHIASASSDQTIAIWDVATGTKWHTLKHRNETQSISFSSDSMHIIVAGFDSWEKISWPSPTDCAGATSEAQVVQSISVTDRWIMRDGKRLIMLPHDYEPDIMSYTPSTNAIAVGCVSGRVYVFRFAD